MMVMLTSCRVTSLAPRVCGLYSSDQAMFSCSSRIPAWARRVCVSWSTGFSRPVVQKQGINYRSTPCARRVASLGRAVCVCGCRLPPQGGTTTNAHESPLVADSAFEIVPIGGVGTQPVQASELWKFLVTLSQCVSWCLIGSKESTQCD